jgi:hypothetical protein
MFFLLDHVSSSSTRGQALPRPPVPAALPLRALAHPRFISSRRLVFVVWIAIASTYAKVVMLRSLCRGLSGCWYAARLGRYLGIPPGPTPAAH